MQRAYQEPVRELLADVQQTLAIYLADLARANRLLAPEHGPKTRCKAKAKATAAAAADA